jgi:alanyl-tRNA synthetase
LTTKLYYNDSYLSHFAAEITAIRPHTDERFAVMLDQTAFYPESGGQPSDRGTINRIPVLDVVDEGADILHILPEAPALGKADCCIDWTRRFDHMQQHSGQHLLSAAAFQATGAETAGFHLGAASSQVDLALDTLTRAQAEEIERAANYTVFANQVFHTHYATTETLTNYPIRKQPPAGVEQIRLIEVPGLDCCPCGGTHVTRAGEIGLIKIRSWERKKGLVRVDFVCGGRALHNYQLITYTVNELSARFSAPSPELLLTVERHFAQDEQVEKQLKQLKQELNEHLTRELLSKADSQGGIKVISHLMPSALPQDIADLAKRLAAHEQTIALIGGISPDESKSHLVFACSSGVKVNMGEELKAVLPVIQGKGGGNPQLAQGGGSETSQTAAALASAKRKVLGLL